MDYWYAIMTDEDDRWDYGFDNEAEAIATAKTIPGAWVAVIESDPECDWWAEQVEIIGIEKC